MIPTVVAAGFLDQVWTFLSDGSHWQGSDGIPHLLLQHLQLTVVSAVVAAAIALPIGIGLGHLRKAGVLAINVANIGRALPALALLILGVQYFGNDFGRHQAPWILRSTSAGRWIFAGTNLHAGSSFARGGIEADETTPSSPRGTQVIAAIPNIFGDGHNAEMSYYELPNGAKVFAAGAFTLAGKVWMPGVAQVLENLWSRLAE